MRKILFIGIQRFFLRSLLENLSNRGKSPIEAFLANSPDEAINTAKNNPDISVVLFMGYLEVTDSENPFRVNVSVAIELNKILTQKAMVAATGDKQTDIELMKNGCTTCVLMMEVGKFLQSQL
jgi:hypothetical protein